MTLPILDLPLDILRVRIITHLTCWPPFLPGPLERPQILAKPSYVVVPGTNVSLHCWIMQSPGWDLTFILLKEGMTGYHSKRKAEREAEFSLPSVGNNSAGSYSCAYFENRNPKRKSQASKTLDLVVTGFFPKPSFSVYHYHEVALGRNVTLLCSLPQPRPFFEIIVFILLKTRSPEPIQSIQTEKPEVEFPLQSLRVQDAGYYTCIYYEKTLRRGSYISESLNICLTDYLPKPSLTVQPSSNVALGGNVIFHCQVRACGTRFTLSKQGEAVGTVDSIQGKAEFLITRVTSNHSGTYKCHYHPGGTKSTLLEFSDPLEFSVTGVNISTFPEKGPDTILIIAISCASILLFLVLLSYYLHRIMAAHKEARRRDPGCQSQHPPSIHPRTSNEEATYEEVSMMGQYESLIMNIGVLKLQPAGQMWQLRTIILLPQGYEVSLFKGHKTKFLFLP
ncbi:immunoglobulin superfamily member 1-like isoform 1-T1 [Sarcophilus harrisii]